MLAAQAIVNNIIVLRYSLDIYCLFPSMVIWAYMALFTYVITKGKPEKFKLEWEFNHDL